MTRGSEDSMAGNQERSRETLGEGEALNAKSQSSREQGQVFLALAMQPAPTRSSADVTRKWTRC